MTVARPRALVTGGHGFIGSAIVRRLVAAGFYVLVLDRKPGQPSDYEALALDINTPEASRAFGAFRPDLVVHAAGQTRVGPSLADPVGDARANIMGTLGMLEAARASRSRLFIYLSSAAIYGEQAEIPVKETAPTRPTSPYGLSKLAATRYVDYYRRSGRLPAIALVPANVYGPRQDGGADGGVVATFLEAARRGEPLPIVGDGRQTRDLLYVGDVAEAVWLCWRAVRDGDGALREVAASGETAGFGAATFNLGTGTETSISALAEAVERIVGRSLGRARLPSRPGEIGRSCLCPDRAAAVLGWSAEVTLEDGLRRTYAWWLGPEAPGQERPGSLRIVSPGQGHATR